MPHIERNMAWQTGDDATYLLKEELYDGEMSLRRRGDKRSQLVPVLTVHVQPILEVRLDGLHVTVRRCRDKPEHDGCGMSRQVEKVEVESLALVFTASQW